MTSIETHKIAVENVMNFFSQYTCFTNLTSNRDKKEFTTIDEYEKKYFYAQRDFASFFKSNHHGGY